MTNPSSYDHYADELLNSVFQNVKQTASPPPAVISREDQLLNQLFQTTYGGLPSPSLYGNSNELFLLQQLKQQQLLLERQQQLLSPAPFHQIPIQSTTVESPLSSPLATTSVASIEDTPVKKIARVPVPVIPEPIVEETPIVEPPVQEQIKSHPPLKKKKSFIQILSERTSRNKEFSAAAAAATAAMKEKSIHQQYKNRKQAQVQKVYVDSEPQPSQAPEPKSSKKEKAVTSVAIPAKPHEVHRPVVERKPSFWKPREERPKGWWKGQRGTKQQPQEEEYEEVEEEVEEEEEEEVVIVPPKKTKKVVVVKRVIVPKKVPSIKATKPKRPMAFKPPPTRKNKVSEKKSKHNETCHAASTTNTTAVQPMYVMPQQMYQQPMYQQPMMMMPQQPDPYYSMPPMMGGGVYQPYVTPVSQEKETVSPVKKNKSIYNPRESTNDKCSIM